MPPTDRRSPWPVVAAASASTLVFVVSLAVVAYATRDVVRGRADGAAPTPGADAAGAPHADAETTISAAAVLAAATPVLEKCFRGAVAFDPSLGGSVRVRLVAAGDGTGKLDLETKGVSPIFGACVARQGARVPLPPLPTGTIAQGRFTLDAAKQAAILDDASAALFRGAAHPP